MEKLVRMGLLGCFCWSFAFWLLQPCLLSGFYISIFVKVTAAPCKSERVTTHKAITTQRPRGSFAAFVVSIPFSKWGNCLCVVGHWPYIILFLQQEASYCGALFITVFISSTISTTYMLVMYSNDARKLCYLLGCLTKKMRNYSTLQQPVSYCFQDKPAFDSSCSWSCITFYTVLLRKQVLAHSKVLSWKHFTS